MTPVLSAFLGRRSKSRRAQFFKPAAALVLVAILTAVLPSKSTAVCIADPVVTNTSSHYVPGSLLKAVTDACPGATITFDDDLFASGPAVIRYQGGYQPIFLIQKELSILGPGPTNLILEIDAGRSLFSVAVDTSVTLAGFTIQPDSTSTWGTGSGIETSGALSLRDCVIIKGSPLNEGGAGGGGVSIYSSATQTLIQRTSILECAGMMPGGGGIRCEGGEVTVEECLIKDCRAFVYPNSIGGIGGAIGVFGGNVSVIIRNSTLIGNTAGLGTAVGVLYNFDASVPSVEIVGSSIIGNLGWYSWGGGGISNMPTVFSSRAHMAIRNSTISGNRGRGVSLFESYAASLESVTITDNHTVGMFGEGAGLEGDLHNTFIYNTVIAGNKWNPVENTNGPVFESDITTNVPSLGFNLIGTVGNTNFSNNTVGDRYGDPNGTTTPNPGAIESATTLSALLAALADNGGPTPTHMPLRGSPVLDNGDPATILIADQRGIARPQGPGFDIGAVERVGALCIGGRQFDEDPLELPGSLTGWSGFQSTPGLASTDYSPGDGALRAHVAASADKFRTAGAFGNLGEWLPYSSVGPDQVVRGRFHVCGGGQADPGNPNQVPNLRVRLSNRFAVNAMLEVFHQNPGEGDPEQRARDAEMRPSTSATTPSLYCVDFDPVDVPYLIANPDSEGIAPGFEAYAIYPGDNGYIALTELALCVYDRDHATSSAIPIRYYEGTALHQFAPSEVSLVTLVPGDEPGDFGTIETTGPQPTYFEGPDGITLSTIGVAPDRVGVASRDLNIDGSAIINYATRPRVKPGTQYTVRWHLTSTQQVNRQAQIRLRARSNKFAWSHKLELGGAWGTDAGGMYPLNSNNSIAQQALPGIGTANPDKEPADTTGGWYTMIIHSPLSAEIRPEFPPETLAAVRMPNLASQPGPGANAFSRRDLFLGIDLVDSLSGGLGASLEEGQVTLERIHVLEFPVIAD